MRLWLVLALGGASLLATAALAEQTEPDAARFDLAPALVRLAPTADTLQRERTRELERRLSQSLRGWPNVARAELLLSLPHGAESPLDLPLPAPRASLVLGLRDPQQEGPARAQIVQLLQASIPALAEADLTLIEHASDSVQRPNRAPAWVSVGPFQVAPESAAKLRLGLGFSLAIHALFAGIVLWRLRAYRLSARKVDPRDRSPTPP